MRKSPILFLVFFILSFTQKDEPTCTEVKLFEKASFPIGVSLDTEKLKFEEKYWTTALAQFNSFTPEMVMKPKFLHPKNDVFDFNETDHLIDFCKQHKIRIHGHTLIWHKSLPVWIEKFKGTSEEWDALLKQHIQTIVKHCSKYIKSWDVVNEAFNDDGSLRNTIWLKNIGPSYIEKAFQYASEADSTAKLFYNDYSIEKSGPKLTAILKFITNLKAKGIKIDGIGMQMHVTLTYPTNAEIEEAALKIQNEGFLVHYSELDVRLTDYKAFVATKKLLLLQKDRMKTIVEGYMKLDPKNRFGITLWGVSDNDSWLSEDRARSRPLLYNSNYKIKPAYCGFLQGLR